MEQATALDIIREAFSHVEVERIVVRTDPTFGDTVTWVVVREDQLDEALRENGHHARLAAILSGLAVGVMLIDESRRLTADAAESS